MRRGIIPSDALAETGPAGIPPYFVPDLKFIDSWGLTDATIARNPVTHRRGRLAHARQPPPGYLRARGVNFEVYTRRLPARRKRWDRGFAVQVGPALWLPFDAPSREWVTARFAQFESSPENARLLRRGSLDVHLESQGNRLLYVKEICGDSEPAVFLHVVPVNVADLAVDRQQYGFENRDFELSRGSSSPMTERCVVVKHYLPTRLPLSARASTTRRAGGSSGKGSSGSPGAKKATCGTSLSSTRSEILKASCSIDSLQARSSVPKFCAMCSNSL